MLGGSQSQRSIAIVTAFYPPAVGGVERYAQGFGRAAAAMGLSVNIITTGAVNSPQVDVEDGGVRILRIPARYVRVEGSRFPIPLSGAREVAQFLQCDLIMAHTRFFLTTPMVATIAAAQGKRIAVLDHGAGPLRPKRGFREASMAYEYLVTAWLRLFSPQFFAVSSASAQWLTRFGVRDAIVLPNGVAARRTMPHRLASGSKSTVFFGGRLLPEKGICELVEAVASLAERGAHIELRVAGSGPLEGRLREWAASSKFLVFLGALSAGEVEAELDRATVFVNPSNLPEGLPTILLEAGAAALPVISTARGGSTDVIHDGVTGWLIPRGEPAAIATALKAAIDNPTEARRRGEALFHLVQRSYTWPTIVARFLACTAEDRAA